MTTPTRTKGFVDPYALGSNDYASLYLDVLEHVPDLTFPMSVPVYSKMRRDPKLSSIIQGWNLNLRRAQWQLDPAGCRPKVVTSVADGMGLAVKGTDNPGAARLRGVSWGDHLGAALRMVPFGFSAFEIEADTGNSQAQLSGLWERPQWTISNIHVDGKSGLLTGASQDGVTGNLGSPQMLAKNLVWYAREREGSNWAGSSLLRPSYASWLIKEEVRRAFAVANVRWSAGVPVNEALPGTNPTPSQMSEAAEMAQQARAGISAGGATPPGFTMKILGITGSLPPTQEFLRWLDQQCASSALMNAFDLGETPNGSRALGTVFMDALHLALESEAEFVADVATRQIAARIVDWNYGEDEPVPRVVVSGVGSRREVTAESLQLLLSSGALAADPGLEEWVRREYRLPERDPDAPVRTATKAPPGQSGGETDADAPAGADSGGSGSDSFGVFARSARKPRPVADGQLTLFAAAGDAAPNAAQIQQQWLQARADLLERWPATAQPMVDELADQAAEADDVSALGQLAVSAGVIAAVALVLNKRGSSLAKDAAAGVVAEAASQSVTITVPGKAGADRVKQTADAIAHLIAAGYASGAARQALQLAGANPAEVKAAVTTHLADLGTSENGLVGDNIGSLLSAAQHAGRLAVLEKHPAKSYRAVEASDGPNRCKPCGDVNGREYPTLTDALKDYPVAGFRGCLGGPRCRGAIFPTF